MSGRTYRFVHDALHETVTTLDWFLIALGIAGVLAVLGITWHYRDR